MAAMRKPSFPYGDGKAAPRIAAIVEGWLKSRGSGTVTSARMSPDILRSGDPYGT